MTQTPEDDFDTTCAFLACCTYPYTVMVTAKKGDGEVVVMAGGFPTNPTNADLADYRKKADEVGGRVWVFKGMYPTEIRTEFEGNPNVEVVPLEIDYVPSAPIAKTTGLL